MIEIVDKASLKVWKEFVSNNLSKLDPKQNPMEVLGINFCQATLSSPSNIPDFVYSTAVNELVARDYLEEAYTLVIKVG